MNRKFIFTFFLAFFLLAFFGYGLYLDLSHRVGKTKVNAEKIDFIGDSLIYWGKWTALFPNKNIVNRGKPGDQVTDVLRRLLPIVNDRSTKAFLMVGTNDLNKKKSADEIIGQYKILIQSLKLTGTSEIYLFSLLPVNEHILNSNRRNQDIIKLNEKLKELAKKLQVIYVDMYESYLDDEQQLRKDITYDGLHLNDSGYAIWQKAIEKLH